MNINKNEIQIYVDALKKGEIVLLPTDTIFGMFVKSNNQQSIDNIFTLKKRNIDKPIGVYFDSINQFCEYVKPELVVTQLAHYIFPGPFTLLIKSNKNFGFHSKANFSGIIGVRVVRSTILNQIIQFVQSPLCGTSVNLSNDDPAINANQAKSIFKNLLCFDHENTYEKNNPSSNDSTLNQPSILVDATDTNNIRLQMR